MSLSNPHCVHQSLDTYFQALCSNIVNCHVAPEALFCYIFQTVRRNACNCERSALAGWFWKLCRQSKTRHSMIITCNLSPFNVLWGCFKLKINFFSLISSFQIIVPVGDSNVLEVIYLRMDVQTRKWTSGNNF